MSNPIPPVRSAPSPAPGWVRGALVLVLVACAAFQWRYATTVAAGSDPSGYLNHARMLTEGRLEIEQRIPAEVQPSPDPTHFTPLGFWPNPARGALVPTYPQGLPLHLALARFAFDWDGAVLAVLVAAGGGALLLLYLCARELGVAPELSLAGAGVLGLSPVFIFSSLQPLSDTLAATWCCAAMWCALRARRGGLAWAWGAGTTVAVAVLVRPTNALIVPAVAVLLGSGPRLVAATLGGLPGALWLAYLNQRLYGHPLASGYGDIGHLLGWEWLLPTLKLYARWLPALLPAVVFVLPFAALLAWRQQGRVLVSLALWWFAITGFYAFYTVTHETWWCLRFVLPALPAAVLGALVGLDLLLSRWRGGSPWSTRSGAIALVLWSAVVFGVWSRPLGLLALGRHEAAYRDAMAWATAHLPPDAVLATLPASGSAYFYTGFPVLRWDLMTAEEFAAYNARFEASGRPVYALLFPGEEPAALRTHMPVAWEKIAEVSGLTYWKTVRPAP